MKHLLVTLIAIVILAATTATILEKGLVDGLIVLAVCCGAAALVVVESMDQ